MSTQFLLIDGYNLLHAAGFARERYGPGQFETCRQRMLQGLADRLTAEQRARTTVVFDAQQGPDDVPSIQRFAGISVVFSVGSDADSLIEAMLAQHPAPRQVIVISSDHRLQNAASRKRATWMDSDKFWERDVDVQPDVEPTIEQRVKRGEMEVGTAEVAEIVERLKADKRKTGAGDETVTGRYERELMERAQEAIDEWNKGRDSGT
ncbi:NYN domain-containing protein [Planctomycetaceae bacterium]|nr:NYN domain-containing protein [Planctomycetaceae bacterium]